METIHLMRWTRPQGTKTMASMTHLQHSRFSARFGLTTPVALAPMALASGGALAAACARAGALGLVGGGYGGLAWAQRDGGCEALACQFSGSRAEVREQAVRLGLGGTLRRVMAATPLA